MLEPEISYEYLSAFAAKRGYFLGPDIIFTKDLIASLSLNMQRYGYGSCPCRLATGNMAEDLDIICPCDYRDQDITEFGACYCGLYVSQAIAEGERDLKPIPERRLAKEKRTQIVKEKIKLENQNSRIASELPIWRCQVCGYLCAREIAPDVCPICGVSHDRFEKFN